MPRPDYSLLIGSNWLHMWPRVTVERRHDATHSHSHTHFYIIKDNTFQTHPRILEPMHTQNTYRSCTWHSCMHTHLSNIRISILPKSHFSYFSMDLLCWQKLVQYSKMTAACLKILVKKLKPLGANGHKPHGRSQAVKSGPVKERERSART